MIKSEKLAMKLKALFWLIVYVFIFSTYFIWDKKLSDGIGQVSFIVGVFLFFYSLALSAIAGRTLKRFAHKKKDEFIPDRFVDNGIYSCMRHPMHLGIGLLPLSFALISGNLAMILASGWGIGAAFWFVLAIEEPETLRKYKDDYIEYLQKTPAFSLSLKCLEDGLYALKDNSLIQQNSKVELKGFEAKYYDKLIDTITLGWYPKFIKQVIKDLDLKEGEKIADFGAGTGRNALLMLPYIKENGEIIGYEIGKEMQKQFLQNTKDFQNIKLKNQSILEDLDKENYFDVVFISFVFHGFTEENREKIIKNAYKVLKPGGTFAILDFNEFDIEKSPFYVRLPIKFLECPLASDFINRDLKNMLSKFNFQDFKVKTYFKNHLRLLKAKKV